jgi:phage terminase large subunit-like protein
MISIADAIADRNLLGAALGSAESWQTWLTCLRAAFGIALNREDRRAFAAVAGSRKSPEQKVRELWVIAGRRSGKSRMAAAVAVYIACFLPHKLARGETGYVLVLSPTLAQSKTIFSYAEAFLQFSPILSQKVRDVTANEIRLEGNIVIATHPNSFRTVRGRTLIAVILDESAYFRDETSALPDVETYRAVMPALA